MTIPAQRYFRILIVGSQNATVAEIIERELNFRTLVIESSAIAGTLRNSADLGAIVVSTADIDEVMRARDARAFTQRRQGVIVTIVSSARGRIAAARARHRRRTRPSMTAWES